jgi:hypothetical protein
MRRGETFPVDMPVKWTTWRYRALARVRVGLLDFVGEIQTRFRSMFGGAGRARAMRLWG